MRQVFVKNKTDVEVIWIKSFTPGEEYLIPADNPSLLAKYSNYDPLLKAIADGEAGIGNGNEYFTSITDQINWLKNDVPQEVEAQILGQPPFADPSYRTKRDATAEIKTCGVSGTVDIDFKLTAERYVSGGEIIISNAKFGDWVEASVYDKDGLIPAPYRPALCEAWPVIAKYLERQWVKARESDVTVHSIDTYPLNAKISAGLYLRITYHASSDGVDRGILVNYYLTKKL